MVGRRLAFYIENKGYKKKEFCEKYGFVYNNFTTILTGRMPLGINVLNKVKEALPNLNIEWLLYGNGSPDLNTENSVNEPEVILVKEDPFEDLLLRYIEKGKVHKLIKKMINDANK